MAAPAATEAVAGLAPRAVGVLKKSILGAMNHDFDIVVRRISELTQEDNTEDEYYAKLGVEMARLVGGSPRTATEARLEVHNLQSSPSGGWGGPRSPESEWMQRATAVQYWLRDAAESAVAKYHGDETPGGKILSDITRGMKRRLTDEYFTRMMPTHTPLQLSDPLALTRALQKRPALDSY